MSLGAPPLSPLLAKGFLCGPNENKEAFFNRVNLHATASFSSCITHALFGFHPTWIQVELSNKGLFPWQGGCTLIDEKGCSIFIKKGLGAFYSKEERIAHEAVHAVRMGFDEPKYEEILAYQTSPSFVRRYFGPVVQNGIEAALFMGTASGAIFASVLATCFVTPLFMGIQKLFFGALLLEIAFGLGRLVKRQYTFKKCQKKLATLLVDPKEALKVQLGLTDKEITTFATMSPQNILAYVQGQPSLRWQQLIPFFNSTNS